MVMASRVSLDGKSWLNLQSRTEPTTEVALDCTWRVYQGTFHHLSISTEIITNREFGAFHFQNSPFGSNNLHILSSTSQPHPDHTTTCTESITIHEPPSGDISYPFSNLIFRHPYPRRLPNVALDPVPHTSYRKCLPTCLPDPPHQERTSKPTWKTRRDSSISNIYGRIRKT